MADRPTEQHLSSCPIGRGRCPAARRQCPSWGNGGGGERIADAVADGLSSCINCIIHEKMILHFKDNLNSIKLTHCRLTIVYLPYQI
jgi:hypothetical protein